MDASDGRETSTGEDAGRKKSPISAQSLVGIKRQPLIESDNRTDSGMMKQTNRSGAKNVNGTRFTIERVHEPEMEGSSVLLSSSKKSKVSLSSKLPEELTGAEPYEKTDMQHMSSLVSNITPSSDDVLSPVISTPHLIAKPNQGNADILGDKMVTIMDEVGVNQEDGKFEEKGGQMVHDKCSAKETDMKPKEKTEEALEKEYQEQLEAEQAEYEERLIAVQQRYQDQLAKEIQKLEKENEEALQRHQEMLAQRLEEFINQLETEQVTSYSSL